MTVTSIGRLFPRKIRASPGVTITLVVKIGSVFSHGTSILIRLVWVSVGNRRESRPHAAMTKVAIPTYFRVRLWSTVALKLIPFICFVVSSTNRWSMCASIGSSDSRSPNCTALTSLSSRFGWICSTLRATSRSVSDARNGWIRYLYSR